MEDLFIRRAYTHMGVTVVVDIDLVHKTLTLVQKNGNEFKPKHWLFKDRGLEYLQGWKFILEAMNHAISQAKVLLEETEKRDNDRFMSMMNELSKSHLDERVKS